MFSVRDNMISRKTLSIKILLGKSYVPKARSLRSLYLEDIFPLI